MLTQTPTVNRALAILLTLSMLLTSLPAPVAAASGLRPDTQTSREGNAPQIAAAQTGGEPCNLYPIGLAHGELSATPPGAEVTFLQQANDDTRFVWLSWSGGQAENVLVTSLTPPGDSATAFVNPSAAADRVLSVRDWVTVHTGVVNSISVRDALDQLLTRDILVPLWNSTKTLNTNFWVRTSAFARVRLVGYELGGNGQVTVRFLGTVECRNGVVVTPTPTRTPTATQIPSRTPTPTGTRLTPTATRTPTATHTATRTPTPTATDAVTGEPTATHTATATATSTATATNTATPTETATDEPTATNTPTPTETATDEPTATNTPTPTETATGEPTATNTATPTETATDEPTATHTATPTETATGEPTATHTPTPTETATNEPTATHTPTPTATGQPTEEPGGLSPNGVIVGEVYDDQSGLPLAGAAVSALPGGAGATTDAQGRFQIALPPGDYTVTVARAGYAPAAAAATTVAGSISAVFDVRLTPQGEAATVPSLLGGALAAGGAMTLTVPALALGQDAELRFAAVGGQGLSGRLPLGWSPLAAADVAPYATLFDEPATLAARLPAPLPDGAALAAARWDETQLAWIALDGAAVQNGLATLPISRGGQYVLLAGDAAPAAPPAPAAGQPLAGAPAQPLPAGVSMEILPSPRIIFARPGAQTQVTVALTAAAAMQSGSEFQIGLEERYELVDGARMAPAVRGQDFVFYAYPGGGRRLEGVFAAQPAAAFDIYSLLLGSIDLAGRLPSQAGAQPGVVFGPDGGRYEAANGAAVSVSAAAGSADLPVTLRSLSAEQLPSSLPGGYELLAGVTLDFYGRSVSQPAALSIPDSGGLGGDQVLVAELVEAAGGTYPALVAVAAPQNGRLVASATSSDVAGLDLPGVRRGGRYLFLRVTEDHGYLTGVVENAAGPVAGAVVHAGGYLAAVANGDGVYTLAAPVGAVEVTAIDPATHDEQTQTGQVAGRDTLDTLSFAVTGQPPQVTAIQPPTGAISVSLLSPITVTFSRPLDRNSVTPGAMTVSAGGRPVTGTLYLAPGGRLLVFQPQRLLASDTEHAVNVTTALTDLAGRPLAAPFSSTFRTIDYEAPTVPPTGAISATIPGPDGMSRVTAGPGVAAPGWLVTIRNLRSAATVNPMVQDDGSFSALVPALISDRLEITLRDEAGNESTFPVPPFRNEDGSVVVGPDGGIVEGAGGVQADVPPGALPNSAVVKVEPLAAADMPLPLPSNAEYNLPYIGGLRLDLGGVTPAHYIDLAVPAPADARPDDQVLVARAVTLTNGSPAWELVDRAFLEDGRYKTASPPFLGGYAEGAYTFLRPADIVVPGQNGELDTMPLSTSDDELADRYSADGTTYRVVTAGADGVLQTPPSAGGDDERAPECVSYISQNYSLTLESFVEIIGAPFMADTLNFGHFMMAAQCNQPLLVRVVDPDNGQTVLEVTRTAPPGRNTILTAPAYVTDDTERPRVVDTLLPTMLYDDQQEVMVRFSEPMDEQTIQANFGVTDSRRRSVSGRVEVLFENSVALFRPDGAFRLDEEYTVVISGTRDFAGNLTTGGRPITFKRAAPASLGELSDNAQLADDLKRCDSLGVCYTAAMGIDVYGDLLFMANGPRYGDETYANPAAPKRLAVVDMGSAGQPKLIGWHTTTTDPRAVAVLPNIGFSYQDAQGVDRRFDGDLLVVVGGGLRMNAHSSLNAELEIYDVTACFHPIDGVENCLDESLNPFHGLKFLSTGNNMPPQPGVPPDQGVAMDVTTLHSRITVGSGAQQRREDSAYAYVLVVPIGVVAVDVVAAFKTNAEESTSSFRYAPDGLYRSSGAYAVQVLKNMLLVAEEPSSGQPKLRLLNASMQPFVADDVYTPRAFRVAPAPNMAFDIDRDGNMGEAEEADDDNGDGVLDGEDIYADDELFDMAVVASGGRTVPDGRGELYVIDMSHRTNLQHDWQLTASNTHSMDARIISRIPLPAAAYEICVDSRAKLAYVELSGMGVGLVDLNHLIGAIRAETETRNLIDDNGDGMDDRLLHIYRNATSPAQFMESVDCTGAAGDPALLDLPGYGAELPGTVHLSWEETGPEIIGAFAVGVAQPITVRTEVDTVNNLICEPAEEDRPKFDLFLSHPATVTVKINDEIIQVDGDYLEMTPDTVDDGDEPVQNVPFASGVYTLPIAMDVITDPGEHTFEVTALYMPGVTKVVTGTIMHDWVKRATLPIGHTMVDGVSLWDGHLTQGTLDINIPGRGLSLQLNRSYSSTGSDSSGVLGAGWSHNLDVRLLRDNCDRFVVVGGEGTGNTFTAGGADPAQRARFTTPTYTPDDDALFHAPQLGYHSTLIEDPDDADPENNPSQFDFFTKARVRYHFEHEEGMPGEAYTLRFIEEPNGNRLTFNYADGDNDPRTLDTVTDSAGRTLRLTYEEVYHHKRIVEARAVVESGNSDLNITVEYEYDEIGNLIKATRVSPFAGLDYGDERVEEYTYTGANPVGGAEPVDRYNMLSYTDPDGHLTEYVYHGEMEPIPGWTEEFNVEPYEFIKEIRKPENVTVAFRYQLSVGGVNTREVEDPRPNVGATRYTLDAYGATVLVEAPRGKVTQTVWCTSEPLPQECNGMRDVLPVKMVDALGRTHTYAYDSRGNMVQETVDLSAIDDATIRPVMDGQSAVSSITMSYTYDPLFGKATSKTDANGNTTLYLVDSDYPGRDAFCVDPTPGLYSGALLGTKDAEGNITCNYYAPNGDLLSVTDPEGNVRRLTEYDSYGNLKQAIDAEGNITTYEYDARGRLIQVSDSMGHLTRYQYDALDRKIVEEKVNRVTASGPGQTVVYRYTPNGSLRKAVTGLRTPGEYNSGLGQAIEYEYDGLGRLVKTTDKQVRRADGTRADIVAEYTYDEAGNMLTETDGRGVVATHVYDELSRRTSTVVTGPNGPASVTTFAATYDLADNLRTETNLHGFTTTYVYDGLYRLVETALPYSHGFADVPFQDAKIVTTYDLVGNKLSETDANGRVTTYTYDLVYRVKTRTDAAGLTAAFTYDKNGNALREESSTGLATSYTYDGLNRKLTMVQEVRFGGADLDDATYTTSYEYLDAANTVIVTNPRGFDTKTIYDSLDRIHKTVADDGGLGLERIITYDAAGNERTVQDPQGGDIDVTHEYDGLNRKIKTTYVGTPSDTGPVTELFFYDAAGNMVRMVDRRGIEFAWSYDNLGRERTHSVAESISNGGTALVLSESQYVDAPAGGRYSIVTFDANRNRTVTYFDTLGRPVEIDDPDAVGLVTYEYDGVNKRSDTDKRGQKIAYEYDEIGRLVRTVEYDSLGVIQAESSAVYDDANLRTTRTDRNGVEVIEEFDGRGRTLRRLVRDENMATHYASNEVVLERSEYDANDNIVKLWDARGNLTTFVYDSLDRKVAQTEAAGTPHETSATWTYDRAGNMLTVKDGRDHGGAYDARIEYDARYRAVAQYNGENEVTRFRYDAADNVVEKTEPLGYRTTFVYDEMNAILAVDESARAGAGVQAGVTRYAYDGMRNRIAQQDANGSLVTLKYDALNRLTDRYQHTEPGALGAGTQRGGDPAGSALYGAAGGNEATALRWQHGHDGNGNETLLVDARGQQVAMTYDHMDRLLTRTYSAFADANLDYQMLSVVYTYDDNGNILTATETKWLNGQSVQELVTYTYDPLNRMQSMTRRDHDQATGKTIAYDYDAQGNRTAVMDPDGRQTTYEYDALNRLVTVTTEAGVTRYQWWEDGLLKLVTYPNNTVHDRSSATAYDRADRLVAVENARTGPAAGPYSTYLYGYDDNGNRVSQAEMQAGLQGGAVMTTTYSYDTLNRVTEVDYGAGRAVGYTYDKVGNRLSEQGIDPITGQPVDRTYRYTALGANDGTYSNVNALTQIVDNLTPANTVTYEYDPNLNQVAKVKNGQRSEYSFDSRDLMVAADVAGDLTRFDYDAGGMRVKKLGADETRYLLDEQAALVEYGGQADAFATQAKYDYGYELMAMTTVEGATRATEFYLKDGLGSTSNLTRQDGALAQSYRYDAWGRLWEQTNAAHANRRQYTGHYRDAETGLHYFGARYYDDEIGRFVSQDPYLGEADTPPSLHRFLYAYDNPLRWVDLTGYSAEEANEPSGYGVQGSFSPNMVTLRRGGYTYIEATGGKAMGLTIWVNGESADSAGEEVYTPDPDKDIHGWNAGDIARRIKKWHRDSVMETEQLLQESPESTLRVLWATVKHTGTELLSDLASPLTLGEGAARGYIYGDYMGYVEDALNLIDLATSLHGGVKALRAMDKVALKVQKSAGKFLWPMSTATKYEERRLAGFLGNELKGRYELATRATDPLTAWGTKRAAYEGVPVKGVEISAKSDRFGIAWHETKDPILGKVKTKYRSDIDIAWVYDKVEKRYLTEKEVLEKIVKPYNARMPKHMHFKHGAHFTSLGKTPYGTPYNRWGGPLDWNGYGYKAGNPGPVVVYDETGPIRTMREGQVKKFAQENKWPWHPAWDEGESAWRFAARESLAYPAELVVKGALNPTGAEDKRLTIYR